MKKRYSPRRNPVLPLVLAAAVLAGLPGQSTVAGAPGVSKWSSKGYLGVNAPLSNDWDKSHPRTNLVDTAERGFKPFADPYGGDSCAVKENGQPAEDFSMILLDNGVTADLGAYLCGFSGPGTPDLIDTDGVIDQLTYTGGMTTFRVTVNSFSGGPRIVISVEDTDATFGDTVPFYVLRPGIARDGPEWGPDWEASLAPAKWWRSMNWAQINGSTETDPEGALAWNTIPYKKLRRLDVQIEVSNRLHMHFWGNVPALSTGAYRDQYISDVQSLLGPGLLGLIEFSNEPWNPGFAAYTQLYNQARTAAGAYAGPSDILSISRTSDVVTAVLREAHGKGSSDQIAVAGIDGLPNSVVDLDSGTSGDTLVWTQAGDDATFFVFGGGVIYLDPTNPICAATANSGVPDMYQAKERWDIMQCRDIKDRIATASASARLRPALGLQLDSIDRLANMMAWCKDYYGDVDWLTWCPAFYGFPLDQETLTTETLVKDALDASLIVARKLLWKFITICRNYGALHYAIYEMGPHNQLKTSGTQAAVAAVHNSDWMRDWSNQLYQAVVDIARCPCCWFMAGAVDTYGTTTDNTWAQSSPHISNHTSSPKWKAMDETHDTPFVPEPISGLTDGTISYSDVVCWVYTHAAGNLILNTNDKLPDDSVKAIVMLAEATTKTLTVYCNGNFGGDKFDVLVDGVVVATEVEIPDANPFSDPAGVAWTTDYVFDTSGEHIVTLDFGTRASHVGLKDLAVTNPG